MRLVYGGENDILIFMIMEFCMPPRGQIVMFYDKVLHGHGVGIKIWQKKNLLVKSDNPDKNFFHFTNKTKKSSTSQWFQA